VDVCLVHGWGTTPLAARCLPGALVGAGRCATAVQCLVSSSLPGGPGRAGGGLKQGAWLRGAHDGHKSAHMHKEVLQGGAMLSEGVACKVLCWLCVCIRQAALSQVL
jgi:hypothetical protein